jgi:hypothetical protein
LPARRSKNKKPRVTPILDTARELLEPRVEGIEGGPLFVLENGTVMSSSNLGHFLLTRRSTLPIAKFTSPDLRRSAATHTAEMGIALDVIAAVMVTPSRVARTLVFYDATTFIRICWSARRMRSSAGTTSSRPLWAVSREGGAVTPTRVLNCGLPTVRDRHALTLLDDTMIAGGEVGPETRSSHLNMNMCAWMKWRQPTQDRPKGEDAETVFL